MKTIILSLLISLNIFAQSPSRERNTDPNFKPDRFHDAATKPTIKSPGEGGKVLASKEVVDAFLKLKDSKTCSWKFNNPRRVTMTGCETTDNRICVGEVQCGSIYFPNVYCSSQQCANAADCLRDHRIDVVVTNPDGSVTATEKPLRGEQ